MKTILPIALLLALALCGTALQAQTRVFRLSLKGNGQALTLKQGNTLTLEATKTGVNQLSQLFIVARQEGGGAHIAPAAAPTLLLKRNGGGVLLAPYDEQSTTSYEWDILYIGHPYLALANPTSGQVLTWQSNAVTMVSPTALTGNDDMAGDAFRFQIETVEDTF